MALSSARLTRRQKLDWMKQNRPSEVRSTALMWLLNAFGTVLGIVCFLVAIVLALNASIGQRLVQWVVEPKAGDPLAAITRAPDTTRITWILAIGAAIIGILCLIIAKLSRKVNRRTWHIAMLEAVADEEDEEDTGEKEPKTAG